MAIQALLGTIHGRYLPNKVLVVAHSAQVQELSQRVPLLAGRTQLGGAPTAYVCQDYNCRLPVTDPQALADQLDG